MLQAPIDSDGCIKQVLIFVILKSSYQFSLKKTLLFEQCPPCFTIAATGFFGRLPGSSFAEDGCHYCSGAQKKAPKRPELCVMASVAVGSGFHCSSRLGAGGKGIRVDIREFQGSGYIIF